jgi:hypothetical protein
MRSAIGLRGRLRSTQTAAEEEAEGEAMTRRRMNRTDWIMLIVLTLLALVGYYFGVIGPAPGLGGYVRVGL